MSAEPHISISGTSCFTGICVVHNIGGVVTPRGHVGLQALVVYKKPGAYGHRPRVVCQRARGVDIWRHKVEYYQERKRKLTLEVSRNMYPTRCTLGGKNQVLITQSGSDKDSMFKLSDYVLEAP